MASTRMVRTPGGDVSCGKPGGGPDRELACAIPCTLHTTMGGDRETAKGHSRPVESCRFPYGGKLSNMYDLGGLVTRLKKLEPEFRKVEEDARKARRMVSRRRFRGNGTIGEGSPA